MSQDNKVNLSRNEVIILSLTRKFLSAMDIDAEKADQIIKAHTDVTDALKEQRDDFKKKYEDLEKVKKDYDSLKDSQGNDETYKEKYEKLLQEYDDFKKDVKAKTDLEAVKQKYKELLSESNIPEKRHAAILRVTDFKDMKLDDKGKFKDKDKLLDAIKTDWSDFVTSEVEKGAKTPDSKGGMNGSTSTMTKESILKIKDAGERQKAIADNHELFGF